MEGTEMATQAEELTWTAEQLAGELAARMPGIKSRHKQSGQCEHPHTCGGCHWFSGYAAALTDVLSMRSPDGVQKYGNLHKGL